MNEPDTDCWFCGGYLPRRLRVGGIHLLCSHAYDEWTEHPMTQLNNQEGN